MKVDSIVRKFLSLSEEDRRNCIDLMVRPKEAEVERRLQASPDGKERGCADPDCWRPEDHPERNPEGCPVVCVGCPKNDLTTAGK